MDEYKTLLSLSRTPTRYFSHCISHLQEGAVEQRALLHRRHAAAVVKVLLGDSEAELVELKGETGRGRGEEGRGDSVELWGERVDEGWGRESSQAPYLGHVRIVDHAVTEDTLCLMHPQAGDLSV